MTSGQEAKATITSNAARAALAGLAALQLATASPAEARRVAIDTNLVETDGCIASVGTCSPKIVPFQFDYGAGLSSAVYIYEGFNSITLTFGSPLANGVNNYFTLYDYNLAEPLSYFSGYNIRFDSYDLFRSSRYITNYTGIFFDRLTDRDQLGDFFLQLDLRTIIATGDDDFSINYALGNNVFQCSGSDCFTYDDDGDGEATVHDTLEFVFRSPVPEPSSWALLISGFGLVGFAARRRASNAHRHRAPALS